MAAPRAKKGEGEKKKLSPKQQMFVKEYLIDLNATQAAIRAGYSKKTAGQIGEQNLNKLEIASEIQKSMDKRAAKIEITAEKVLQEIAKLAFANLQDFYEENGSLKEIAKLPRDIAVALSSSKVNLTEACAVQEIKLHDKKGSLELLGRHLKLFTDKTELTGNEGSPLTFIMDFSGKP